MLSEPASPSSILAIVTTVHLGLAALRNHRSPSRLPLSAPAVVSFAFTAVPWALPSAAGLALGVGVHLVWFAVCELLMPAAAPESDRPAVRRETPSVRPAARAGRAAAAPPGRPAGGFQPVPVLAVLDEAPAIKTIRVGRPEGFSFSPGQFVPVRVRVDGKELTRCYSISSAPAAQGYLEISVKRQGVVSSALHATARPGAVLHVRAPAGAFTYPAGDDRPLVLIAGGIGITPLMSMTRHAVATEPQRPVTLLYCTRGEADFAFRDELECLARRHPQLRLQLAATEGATSPRVYHGRIDASLLRATVPALADSIACLCGPTPMIDGMKALLGQAGMPAAQIRYEVFEAAIAAASSAPARSAPAAGGGKQHRVRCAKSGAELAVPRGRTLLEAAEHAGVEIASLCRAGVCGTCRVQVASGDVDCDSSTLAADEVDAGFVLACVATLRSDCVVDL